MLKVLCRFFLLLVLLPGAPSAFAQEVETQPLWTAGVHRSVIMSVAFSPDGKHILSGGEDGLLKLLETSTGREVRTFSGHAKVVTSVAFSPDGKHALSGSWDRTVRLWDLGTGNEVGACRGHTSLVNSVAFSPDGKYVLSGSSDKTVKLWELGSCRELRTFEGHLGPVVTVAFTAGGKQAVSAGDDAWGLATVRLWDIGTGRLIFTHKQSATRIICTAVLPDGTGVLYDANRSRINGLDFSSGKIRRVATNERALNSIAVSPDGRVVLSGDITGLMKVFDLKTGNALKAYRKDSSEIWSVAYSPDGAYVLSGGRDGALTLWSAGGLSIK